MKKTMTLGATAVLALACSGALAQTQEGLVNLSVDGNTVQVPVGVAANVCDVDANVLAQDFVGTEDSACEIDQETAAANNIGDFGGAAGGTDQEGLVNVSVEGNTVQVPIGIAANACDIEANVLARDFAGSEESACEIDQETAANNNIGEGGVGGGGGNQEGLVNLSVDGNTVQVPIGIAANVCDVDANVLAQDFAGSEDSACDIDQETAAANGIGDAAATDDAAATEDAAAVEETTETTTEEVADTAEDAAEEVENVTPTAGETAEDAEGATEETVTE